MIHYLLNSLQSLTISILYTLFDPLRQPANPFQYFKHFIFFPCNKLFPLFCLQSSISIIKYTMLIFQEDYQKQFFQINNLKCSRPIKIKMLAALANDLKVRLGLFPASTPAKTKTIITEETQNSETSSDLSQRISELEKNIILKRDIKIQLHEQIEDAEEQFQNIQRTVFLKQQIDDELKLKIDMKMFEIEAKQSLTKKKETPRVGKVNKTFSIFSHKVLDFFS